MFEGFTLRAKDVAADVRLRVRVGGDGPPIILLHGHPPTHTTWHRVAPLLVQAGFTVICPDLRGYGRSTGRMPLPHHSQASKREMAKVIVTLTACSRRQKSQVGRSNRGWHSRQVEQTGRSSLHR